MGLNAIRFSLRTGIFGMWQYVIISSITMFFYSGGDRFNPSAEGYNYFASFLSDLGRTHGFDGLPTFGTASMYGVALLFMGIGSIFYFLGHRYLLPNINPWTRNLSSWLGCIAGLGYIGIALTPWDQVPILHLVAVFTGFFFFLFTCIANFFAIRKQQNYPNRYGWVYLLLGVVMIAYILFMIFGASSEYQEGRFWQATFQKALVYFQTLVMTYVAYGALKQSKRIE